jgi:hypothetical protein
VPRIKPRSFGSVTTVVRVAVVVVELLVVVLVVEYTSTSNNTWKLCVLVEETIKSNYHAKLITPNYDIYMPMVVVLTRYNEFYKCEIK